MDSGAAGRLPRLIHAAHSAGIVCCFSSLVRTSAALCPLKLMCAAKKNGFANMLFSVPNATTRSELPTFGLQ
eukprot:4009131-Amphidinium_carterae.1